MALSVRLRAGGGLNAISVAVVLFTSMKQGQVVRRPPAFEPNRGEGSGSKSGLYRHVQLAGTRQVSGIGPYTFRLL